MSINYKEQIVIMGINSGMQYSICHIPPEKRKNLCKVWPRQTHEIMHLQFARQNTVEGMKENGIKHLDYMHSMTNFV